MAVARDIIRGTFRLSLAVAFLAGVYGAYERWATFSERYDRNFKMAMTLECGARLPEETLKPIADRSGVVDLSAVGCAREPFRASFDELRQARDGAMRKHWLTTFDMRDAAAYAFWYAVFALVVVNLLGLTFAAVNAVVRWIVAGFTPRT